jgi:hypothetical protein
MTSPRSFDGAGSYAPSSYSSSTAFPSGTPIYDRLVAERGTPQIAPINVPPALPPANYSSGPGNYGGYESSGSNLPALASRPALGPGPGGSPGGFGGANGGYGYPQSPQPQQQMYAQPQRPSAPQPFAPQQFAPQQFAPQQGPGGFGGQGRVPQGLPPGPSAQQPGGGYGGQPGGGYPPQGGPGGPGTAGGAPNPAGPQTFGGNGLRPANGPVRPVQQRPLGYPGPGPGRPQAPQSQQVPPQQRGGYQQGPGY